MKKLSVTFFIVLISITIIAQAPYCSSTYSNQTDDWITHFEFNNIINNIRKGPKWNEHDRKINLLTNTYYEEQKELQTEENKELISRKKEIEDKFFLQSQRSLHEN